MAHLASLFGTRWHHEKRAKYDPLIDLGYVEYTVVGKSPLATREVAMYVPTKEKSQSLILRHSNIWGSRNDTYELNPAGEIIKHTTKVHTPLKNYDSEDLERQEIDNPKNLAMIKKLWEFADFALDDDKRLELARRALKHFAPSVFPFDKNCYSPRAAPDSYFD